MRREYITEGAVMAESGSYLWVGGGYLGLSCIVVTFRSGISKVPADLLLNSFQHVNATVYMPALKL